MDGQNRFETRNTYLIGRAENLVGLIGVSILTIIHLDSIRWVPFIVLFSYIDLIGYLPGALAHRRQRHGTIAPIYYFLYNTTHNWIVTALVAGFWCVFVMPEWALLALPIHLFGDRSLFGNSLKPLGIPFEPEVIPAFKRFELDYENYR